MVDTFGNFTVGQSGVTLIRQLPVPLLPLSFTPNLINVILSTINSLSLIIPSPADPENIQNSLARSVVNASPCICLATCNVDLQRLLGLELLMQSIFSLETGRH